MIKGRWKASAEKLAIEAFLVLIKKQKASKSYSRQRLVQFLARAETRTEFLKLCLEYDDSDSLVYLRSGLLLSVKAIGPSKVASNLGVNRVSLYRMLSPSGNPSLRYIIRLTKAFGLRLWTVDEDFFLRREKLIRPKDIVKDMEFFEEWIDGYWGENRQSKKKGNRRNSDEWDDVDGFD